MVESKWEVKNIFPTHTKIEFLVSAHIAFTTEELVAKEIPTLVADSLDDTL